MKLKHIFGTLENFKQKTFRLQSCRLIENINFGVDHIDIQVCLKILNFKFQNP